MGRLRDDLVRLFPDYADTVISFPYPVDYADTGLDDDLVTDLRRWEALTTTALTTLSGGVTTYGGHSKLRASGWAAHWRRHWDLSLWSR